MLAESGSSGNYSQDGAQRYAREAIIQHLSTLLVDGTINPKAPLPQTIGGILLRETYRSVKLRSGLVTFVARRDSWIHLADQTPGTESVIVDFHGWALPLNIDYYGKTVMAEARELAMKVVAADQSNYIMSAALHELLAGIRANDIVAFVGEPVDHNVDLMDESDA